MENLNEEVIIPGKPNLRESKSVADLLFKKEGWHKPKLTTKQRKNRKASKAAGKARKLNRK